MTPNEKVKYSTGDNWFIPNPKVTQPTPRSSGGYARPGIDTRIPEITGGSANLLNRRFSQTQKQVMGDPTFRERISQTVTQSKEDVLSSNQKSTNHSTNFN